MSEQTQQEQSRAARGSRQNLIFALLSLCLCLSIPAAALLGSQASFGHVSDFPEFYTAAKMSAGGDGAAIYNLDSLFTREHHYFPQMLGRGLGFYIAPFAVPLLGWLSFFSVQDSFLVFMAAALAAILASVFFLRKAFALNNTETVWLLTLLCASAPLFESLKLAQLAPFLLLGLSAYLWLAERKKVLAAGAALSLLLLKPQELLPLVIFLLASLRIKTIAGLAGIFALLAAVSLGFPGSGAYKEYARLLSDSASNTVFMQPELSATIRGQLLRIPQLHSAANVISLAALGISSAIIACFAFKTRKNTQDGQNVMLRLALPLGLASALHCHDYDLLLLLPWFIAVYKSDCSHWSNRASKTSCAILLLLLIVPFYIPIHYRWLLEQQQTLNPIFLVFISAAFFSALSVCHKAVVCPEAPAHGSSGSLSAAEPAPRPQTESAGESSPPEL